MNGTAPILVALVLASGVTGAGTSSARQAIFLARAERKSATEAGSATNVAQPKPLDAPVDVYLPVPPTAFKADGATHLVYELHITNFSSNDCTMTRVEILDGAAKQTLAQHEGDDLAKCIRRPGVTAEKTTEKLKIGGGLRAIVYMWVTIATNAPVPSALLHRLNFKVGDHPEQMTVECAHAAVGNGLVVLSPPLRGGEWLAGNGPSNNSLHRRALIPVGGGAHIAQRFAIDWVQLREDGRTYSGDQKDNRNYRCHGAEALAVADGVVAAVKDGIPENVPGLKSRAVPITLETVGGNHVVLDIGNGRYAFYAHLQPGQIRVTPGEKVRRGQVLGLVGNSGNSTEPHLHFQISDGYSPLRSEGLPYALQSFEVQGKGWGWKSTRANVTTNERRTELPLELQVVRFPSTQ